MKYIIECNDDNSFKVLSETIPHSYEKEVKDMVSFSLQYLYSVLNHDTIKISKSGKEKISNVISSFEFSSEDINDLSKLIAKMGYQMNKSMMIYDNGIPKNWVDEI